MKHDPDAIHREVVPALCASEDSPESRRAALRGVRRNYQGLRFARKNDVELQSTLAAIDRALRTLPACAGLKGGIEGLDCGRFAEAKPQAASKAPNPKR